MMKKTLAAIARDRRCQALMSLMKKGSDRLWKSGRQPQTPTTCQGKFEKKPDNIFLDI